MRVDEVHENWNQQSKPLFQVTETLSPKPQTMGQITLHQVPDDVPKPTVTTSKVPMAVDSLPVPEPDGSGKPKVLIIATGGTIAGRGLSPTHTAGYESGVLCVSDLVEAVPSLKGVAEVSTRQICKVGSPDLPSSTLITLSQTIQAELARDDLAGIVITHGTDTLEETSFFLDITVNSPKPVVVTGSMLPSTGISADGPKNLHEAVCVAADPCSKDRGVLVVFNGKIMPARFTVKRDANMMETFDPGHQGCLGQVVENQPLYYWPPARPLGHRHVDISSANAEGGLPRVGIIYGYLGVDNGIFETYVRSDVKGLILAGMGAGCWTHEGKEQLEREIGGKESESGGKPKIPVVTSFRGSTGCVILENGIFGVPDWVIRSGFLNPAKSCKLLQACLLVKMSQEEIKTIFSVSLERRT
ncbi:L-asparaginase 2-2 [Sarocladium implicatum]|nr:L-asparaginase 2-2 [Sarocladium implicatum]